MQTNSEKGWMKIPDWLKNKFVLATILFLIILLFLDGNSVFDLFQRQNTLRELNQQEQKYEEELIELREQKEAFEHDTNALKRFAREEYRMKKDDEDVFVIIEEDEKDN